MLHIAPEKPQEEGHPHGMHFIMGTSAKNFPIYSCLSQLVFPFLLCPSYAAKMPHQACESLTEESKNTSINCKMFLGISLKEDSRCSVIEAVVWLM